MFSYIPHDDAKHVVKGSYTVALTPSHAHDDIIQLEHDIVDFAADVIYPDSDKITSLPLTMLSPTTSFFPGTTPWRHRIRQPDTRHPLSRRTPR
jgi:hypothetical protein